MNGSPQHRAAATKKAQSPTNSPTAVKSLGKQHQWTFPRSGKAWPVAAEDRPLPHATASHPKQEEQSGYKAESQTSRHSENSSAWYQKGKAPPCLTTGLRGLDAYLGNDRELNVKCL